ncbi:hypothetical protein AB0E08_08315 [Streptomyces sp. NPDC048281]|uniref:hypothetical protein n=1 Tax=Streptomyces sp. NPDC048281 TaxID=3154715 RepID=UPI0034212C5F
MTFDLDKALAGPPDFTIGSEQLIASGTLIRCEDETPHQSLNGSPITYVSARLWAALGESPLAQPWPKDSSGRLRADRMYAMLRDLAAEAVDSAELPNAEEGEPVDGLYITASAVFDGGAVWFSRGGSGGPITALLPSDW